MKVTLNWDHIAKIGETANYKAWYDYKRIPYKEIFTTVERSPSLEGPTHKTLQVHVKDTVYSFYLCALTPVVEVKPLEDWM